MSRHPLPRARRIALLSLVCFAGIATGCSDDGGGDEAAPTTTDESAWCASVRRSQNTTTAQVLSNTKEQAEVAPPELAADYDALIELYEYRMTNPGDAVGNAELTQTSGPALARILTAVTEQCDIELNLYG